MTYSKGLEGVVAGETAISNVEGDIGRLSYRGYGISELATLDYEAVVWLVLFGELPDSGQQKALGRFLCEHGQLSEGEKRILGTFPKSLHPMRMLQAMMPLLEAEPESVFETLDEEATQGLMIVARIPALIAYFRQHELSNIEPTYLIDADYLGRFLTMFTGQENPAHVNVLRVAQILQIEHSFNASTFTSRVVASTQAPIDSVLSAATGALFGRLHGGADQAALADAKRVGSPDQAAPFIRNLLAERGLLMGMGHREYRTIDPRASILKPMAAGLCEGTEFENDYLTLAALEEAFSGEMKTRGKDVWANVEFYKGAVFETLGLPEHYFTAMFTMARSVGWLAHFVEARQEAKIMRPKADYVGHAVRQL